MGEYRKPLPTPDLDSQLFWEGCRRHELILKECLNCGAHRFVSRLLCPHCHSEETRWVKANGKGEVYTYTVMHQPYHPAFAPDLPYVVAMIELEEGVKLISNVIGCRPQEVKVGMKVEVVFDDVTDEVTLPKFRPVA
ncbi:MAG: Zn-ribbon domain-containing OB-fold protein [Candidatus Tectomicrobia bacterium]|nr:Zn-ribbon domain-containing OB-fold protein [Candidatus Tectomicrobia bacterium]